MFAKQSAFFGDFEKCLRSEDSKTISGEVSNRIYKVSSITNDRSRTFPDLQLSLENRPLCIHLRFSDVSDVYIYIYPRVEIYI